MNVKCKENPGFQKKVHNFDCKWKAGHFPENVDCAFKWDMLQLP